MLNRKVAVLGAGNIGRALIGGLLRSGELRPEQVRATRRDAEARAALARDLPGIVVGDDNRAAVADADVVVLAVKPQGAPAVLAELADAMPATAMLVSVLAGLTCEALETALGRDVAVVRTMPNTPMLVDAGATAIAAGRHATEDHLDVARRMFAAVGRVEVVPEEALDAVTGLSGSGPAYVYMFIEALTDAGVKQGLSRPVAARLAAQTVFGAAKLALDSGRHPALLRDEVTTPGGTAIAAVAELEAHGLRTMLIHAVATATARSRELAGG